MAPIYPLRIQNIFYWVVCSFFIRFAEIQFLLVKSLAYFLHIIYHIF